MKASGRGLTAGRERFSLRRGLVVLQVALSLVLVTGAFLFTRSLDKLQKVDTGFRPEGVLITQSGFARLNLQPDQRLALRGEILIGLKQFPELRKQPKLCWSRWAEIRRVIRVWLDGSDASQKLETAFSWVGPNYFKTLQTPLLAGRDFNDHDVRGAPKVALVNETLRAGS